MPAADELPMLLGGTEIGRWVVDRCLAPSVPRVYEVRHRDEPDERAILTTLPKDAASIDLVRREAAMLRSFAHPALPGLIDFGIHREHELVWMATTWFAGDALEDRLLSGALGWREACRVFYPVAEALRHVHEHGYIHRDVNPRRIVVAHDLGGPGTLAQLHGFESALDANEASQSAARIPYGPLSYLAPEIILEGKRVSPRADLYALGVVFYEALAGVPAFPAAFMDARVDPKERMIDWKTRSAPLHPGDKVPGWLANLLQKATHPNPVQRLPDLDAFVNWLDAARETWEAEPEPEAAAPVAVPPPIRVTPSLAPPVPSALAEPAPVPGPANDDRGWMPLAYMTAGVLGMALGLACSIFVILAVELPGA